MAYMRLERLFGPLYLDGGPLNRLSLSLRSRIPDDTDFALSRLLHYSHHDPTLLRLDSFPGLLDALLDLIEDVTPSPHNVFSGSNYHKEHSSDSIRRAADAALILRNIASGELPLNISVLASSTRIYTVIAPLLQIIAHDQRYSRQYDYLLELTRSLLEILEVISSSPTFRLSFLEPSSPLFDFIKHSQDRAFLISAFRILANAATAPENESFFTSPPAHAAFDRALELLSLEDPDFHLAILDYIYAYSFISGNDFLVCTRPDIFHLLRLLVYSLEHGATAEEYTPPNDKPFPHLCPPKPQHPLRSPQNQLSPNSSSIPESAVSISTTPKPSPAILRRQLTIQDIKLSEAELAKFVDMPEPKRTLKWMQHVFEYSPEAEITQVNLWTAYRREFEAHDRKPHAMLAAAEVIKHTTEAFPHALPMVTTGEDRRFIIKNMKIKDRVDSAEIYQCHWFGCEAATGACTAKDLYLHIRDKHVNDITTPIPPPPTISTPANNNNNNDGNGGDIPVQQEENKDILVPSHSEGSDIKVPQDQSFAATATQAGDDTVPVDQEDNDIKVNDQGKTTPQDVNLPRINKRLERFRCRWLTCEYAPPSLLLSETTSEENEDKGEVEKEEKEKEEKEERDANDDHVDKDKEIKRQLLLHVSTHVPASLDTAKLKAGEEYERLKRITEAAGKLPTIPRIVTSTTRVFTSGGNQNLHASSTTLNGGSSAISTLPVGASFLAALAIRVLALCVRHHLRFVPTKKSKRRRIEGLNEQPIRDAEENEKKENHDEDDEDGEDDDDDDDDDNGVEDQDSKIGWDVLLSGRKGQVEQERKNRIAKQIQLERARRAFIALESELLRNASFNSVLAPYLVDSLEMIAHLGSI